MAQFEVTYVIGQEYRATIEGETLEDVWQALERGEFDGVGTEGDIYRTLTWWNSPPNQDAETDYVVDYRDTKIRREPRA